LGAKSVNLNFLKNEPSEGDKNSRLPFWGFSVDGESGKKALENVILIINGTGYIAVKPLSTFPLGSFSDFASPLHL